MDHKEHIIESNEHDIRKGKVEAMKREGLHPWAAYKPVSHTTLQAIQAYQKNPENTENFIVAGRLMTRRDHGKTFFANLQDRSGVLQLYIKKDDIGEQAFEQFKKYTDLGDIVWAQGTLFVTKTGEITLKVTKLELLSKCLHPLPEKFHGLTDIEQRYRHRYLDLISNPESQEKFKKRSHIIQTIRNFLQAKDFLEVETPMLHPIPGGATARPFVTHHNAYNMDLYLRIAPELYLKRLVVGGFERVFEINRNFRNEGVSTRHNPEFTMLEFYMAHGDYKTGMDITEKLLQNAVQKNCNSLQVPFQNKIIDFSSFKRLTIQESLLEIAGFKPEQLNENIDTLIKQEEIQLAASASYGLKIYALFEKCVEHKIVQPTFIIGMPIEVSPLSKCDEENPEVAARFELFICGMEFANSYSELNDPFDQAERFKAQAHAREGGDVEAHYYDADYINALEYGMPPTVGVGIGIDRLVMILTDTSTIKDVILFPTLKLTSSTPAPKINKEAKPTKFVASPALLRNFSNPRIAITLITNADNTGKTDDLMAKIHDISETIRKNYTSETLAQVPHIAAWREAYRTFGSKPSEFPSSIESLYKRILRGQQLNSVNPLVDIYNYISLKYMLPAGGEDIDAMQGDLELTYATSSESPVMVLGKDSQEAPYAGEVIYKDGLGTICRRWNWREVKRTVLTSKTKNAVLVLEALAPVDSKILLEAQTELAELVKQYCHAEIKHTLIDANNTVFNFYDKE